MLLTEEIIYTVWNDIWLLDLVVKYMFTRRTDGGGKAGVNNLNAEMA